MVDPNEIDRSSNLRTALEGNTKTYVIHDANNRITAAFEAKATAKSGEPCLVTYFAYRAGAGVSSQVRVNQEANGKWDPDNEGWDAEIDAVIAALPNPLRDPNI